MSSSSITQNYSVDMVGVKIVSIQDGFKTWSYLHAPEMTSTDKVPLCLYYIFQVCCIWNGTMSAHRAGSSEAAAPSTLSVFDTVTAQGTGIYFNTPRIFSIIPSPQFVPPLSSEPTVRRRRFIQSENKLPLRDEFENRKVHSICH